MALFWLAFRRSVKSLWIAALFSLLFSRKDIRAGKDFQPEMNAQMLIRHRVDISVRYVSRHQGDIVFMKCIKSSRVKIFRRGWVLLIFPRADADGIERKIVNSGILCCLPENFDEREVGLNAQRRFDEICPECHFPSSHLFLNNISSTHESCKCPDINFSRFHVAAPVMRFSECVNFPVDSGMRRMRR